MQEAKPVVQNLHLDILNKRMELAAASEVAGSRSRAERGRLYMMMHPKRDNEGKMVEIRKPSLPTDASSWAEPTCLARATPGSIVPSVINGIAVKRASPSPYGKGWEKVVLYPDLSDTPPLKLSDGKRPSAGAVVIEADARVWLVEPTNGYFGYTRTFPKGTQDSSYSLAATAAKEVFEETGLCVEIGEPLIDVERKKSVCRYFLARRIGGDPSDMGWETQAVCLAPVALLAEQEEKLPSEYDRPVLLALLRWLSSNSGKLMCLENLFSPTGATR